MEGSMATRQQPPRTASPNEPRPTNEPEVQYEDENEVTRPSDLGFGPRNVEVQPVEMPREVGADGMVQIRMARTIEEFTYGNPHVHYPLEEGKIYRMPVDIARYLYGIGALSNIA
jgi:hypothetical protein